MKKNIYFDLDGTLVDSKPGIFESVKYALSFFGIEEKDEEKLNLFIGPPLFDAFVSVYGMDEKEAEEAVAKYRENYRGNNAILKYAVYDGVEKMLKDLKESGKKLYVATAKPTEFAKKILDDAGLSHYFEEIFGASFDETRRTKSKVIAYAIEQNNHNKEEILMVGDRENDVTGAMKNEISVIGILYGYGTEEELKEAGCKTIVSHPEEVKKYILN